MKRHLAIALTLAALILCPPAKLEASLVLDLADIVGGGDGTGTGGDQGVDPRNGTVQFSHAGTLSGSINLFNPVAANPFIDGVFVPDGGPGGSAVIPISSTGLTATGIADSGSPTWDHIWNGNNVGVGTVNPTTSRIGFHANKGITFDLDAIEAANPGSEAISFQTLAAVEDGANVEFTMLVDGVIVQQQNLSGTGSAVFSTPLAAGDRFLTLIASSDPDFFFDHSIFGDPLLTLRLEGATVPEPASIAVWLALVATGAPLRRRCKS